ncbi:MAG: LacI family DNA-binding transcriptional regulator [Anaerolineaceae bacterium]|nr:LacI family DNA-binding transcriptional regulator [Anaerolineaceae bacterium]
MAKRHNERPLNLKDIAKKAGVSKSTVSRVVNGGANVSKRTLEKVNAVIKAEGFVPNPGGRILHLQQTHIIGIVMLHSLQDTFEDPFYFPLFLQGVHQVTHKRGYATLLWIDGGEDDEEQFYNRILKNRLMDGLLIASSRMNTSVIERLLAANTQFVMVERPPTGLENVNYVISDTAHAAYGAVKHLIEQGYQRIATITGRLDHVDGIDRLAGYQQALREFGLPVDEDLIVAGDFTYASGYGAMQTLLHQNVDAVFAATDRSALGAYQAIQEAQLRVPEDIALIGFDDLAQYVQPPILNLTSVRHHITEKSAQATSLLLDLIEDKCEAPQQIVIPTELIIRKSSHPH